MTKFKVMLLFIITLATLAYATPFSTYKEYLGLSDAKQDSFYVVNPVISFSMDINDTSYVNIEDRFSLFLSSYDPDGVEIVDNSLITATQIVKDDSLHIRIISHTNIGRTNLTYTVYSEDSLGVELETSDTFTVTVDDPTFDWNEWGENYSFNSDYCVGWAGTPWKAATHFSLGNDNYTLKQIEFGFAFEELVDWKIVKFNEVPIDTLLCGDMADSVLCTAAGPTYIEGTYIDTAFTDTYLTGDIALVFSAGVNFMSLDPTAASSNTWIMDETHDWALANSHTSLYNGAWYMRMQVLNRTTGIEEIHYSGTISNFELFQNYPNPFNPTTEINFTLNQNSHTKLTVYNTKGEMVKILNNSKLAQGSHSFSFDGQDLNSGVYFYQLEVDGVRSTKKMILMK